MNSLLQALQGKSDTKATEKVTSHVKLINTLGQSVVVVLGLALASYKLANEMKKD